MFSSPILSAIQWTGGMFKFNETITTNMYNYRLWDRLVTAGWDMIAPVEATVTVASGVDVGGGTVAGVDAFTTTPPLRLDPIRMAVS